MKILFLTTILPLKTNSGGEIVSKLFIDNLINLEHSVDVVGYLRHTDTITVIPANMHLAKKVVIESKSSLLFTMVNLLKSIVNKRCYSSQKYITKEYVHTIKNLLKSSNYQLIIIDHFQMGWVLKHLPSKINIVSIAHNVESDLYQQQSEDMANDQISRYIYRREANRMQHLEGEIIQRAKLIWLLTQSNKDRYSELFPKYQYKLNVTCIPPSEITDKEYDSSVNIKKWDIGIIGTWTWKANMDGLMWFFEKVYPLLPIDTTICVAGRGGECLLGKYNNVKYLGFIDNANTFMKESKLIAIPSIVGDGIQIKTLQAITLGLPIVATSFALRGIENLPSYVRGADDPKEFKEQLMFQLKSGSVYENEAVTWTCNRKHTFVKELSIVKELE